MKFDIEMCAAFNANLTVEAKSQKEAIEKAKEMVSKNPTNYCDEVFIEEITYIKEISK